MVAYFTVIITACVLLFMWLENTLTFLLLLLIFNALMLLWLGKVAIKHLLFPFGQSLVKFNYHQQMNEKMTKELKGTLIKVRAVVEQIGASREHLQITQL